MAVVAINVGEMQLQAVVTVPAIPARAAAEAMKWATDRIGPAVWVIAGRLTGGGIYWYCKQPPERRGGRTAIPGCRPPAPRRHPGRPAPTGLTWPVVMMCRTLVNLRICHGR